MSSFKFLVFLILVLSFANAGFAGTAIFPQYADGRWDDGSHYKSTLIVQSYDGINAVNCNFRVLGGLSTQKFTTPANQVVTADGNNNLSFALKSLGVQIFQSVGTGSASAGYATLTCVGAFWDAFMLYSYYDANGKKLSEATVFANYANGSGNALTPVFAVDYREGAVLGIAIANNESRNGNYNLIVKDMAGNEVGRTVVTVGASRSIARFLDQWITLPPNFVGKVVINPVEDFAGPAAYVIGLRFTGQIFSTVPPSMCYNGNLCR